MQKPRPNTRAHALEVRVAWGEDNWLRVEHACPPRPFVVGEHGAGGRAAVDFELGRETLGQTRLVLVEPLETHASHAHAWPAGVRVFVPEGASIEVDRAGVVHDQQALVAGARLLPSTRRAVAFECRLGEGERATVRLGAFVFVVALVPGGEWAKATISAPVRGLAYGAAATALAFVAVLATSVAVHHARLGDGVRHVETRIDLSNPTVAALVARRASSSRARPTVVHPSVARFDSSPPSLGAPPRDANPPADAPVDRHPPPATPRVAPSSSSPPAPNGSSQPSLAREPMTTSNEPTSVRTPESAAAANPTRPAATVAPGAGTAPNEATSASAASAALDDAHARRVALMFAMRRGVEQLDCYTRFPATGRGAATNASHLAECLAATTNRARAAASPPGGRANEDTASEAAPGREAALVEWDIEVDTHAGGHASYAGGRMFVVAEP